MKKEAHHNKSMKNQNTPALTVQQAEKLKEGDNITLEEFGTLMILDPKFPVIRKGGEIIQRSLLVRTTKDRQKLLIVSDNLGISLVTV